MVLFERVLIERRMYRNVWHHSIHWITARKSYMIAISRARTKGDWWKKKGEEKARFFSWDWKCKSEEFTRTGLYVGRVAIVVQNKPAAE